ncbi:protein phosphatase 2C 55 [Pyrus ussuriensis x Pyrus communis]|uniref:Protein phosphatase n=1 Tax=Pyrus ussuriensis x Pyrus communis TaxID=2448454 RepID=A0A5N5HLY3_9ROSA|nr:protein phosphatase 2C 55 [Pyrus ussuriensis x Pyrus communis]
MLIAKKPRVEEPRFICPEKQTNGVADGVGGWTKGGVDAGDYAREQMMLTEAALSSLMLKYVNYNGIINNNNCHGQETKRNLHEMVCGSVYLPKDNKLGEDAHFICPEKQTIGVADGVGGWAKKGIDAGQYARELMHNAFIAVHNPNNIDEQKRKRKVADMIGAVDPRKVLQETYAKTKEKGSSTACILSLNKESGVLHAVNVGDSGFLLFRNNKVVYQSPTQQRRFNCPYQLGNGISSDRPDSAWEEWIQTVPGDIIVLGTDGLLDNMFPSEIEQVLVQGGGGDRDLDLGCGELASSIANLALYNSFDKHSPSPFSENARKAGFEHKGGKIDDITVIVAQVVAL